ncbi:MAG: DUF4398 domain-containing protein [Deltaproteobacteria bacterium]|nr:DUF4398 domain-containing protein [Deltaproteobacteria bacterium]
MLANHVGRLKTVFCVSVAIAVLGGVALAENITPAQEQEFTDAKAALETARKIQAEKNAPEPFKQAVNFLQAADNARQQKDAVAFSRASRLARTYADLAKATTEFNAENAKLAVMREELKKIQLEIERLQKSP